MTKQFAEEPCPICADGRWIPHADGVHCFSHKRKEHKVKGMHYMLCNKCEARGFTDEQNSANHESIARYQAQLRDYISPSDIYAIREKYMLSQADAAKIFSCGISYFSKWERGEVAPTGPTAVLLQEALADDSLMQRLAEKSGVKISIPEKCTASSIAKPLHEPQVYGESVGRLLNESRYYSFLQFDESCKAAVEKAMRQDKGLTQPKKRFKHYVKNIVFGLNPLGRLEATTLELTQSLLDDFYGRMAKTSGSRPVPKRSSNGPTSAEIDYLNDWSVVDFCAENFAIHTPGSS